MSNFKKWLKAVFSEEFRIYSLSLKFPVAELFSESPVSYYTEMPSSPTRFEEDLSTSAVLHCNVMLFYLYNARLGFKTIASSPLSVICS